MIAMLRYLHIPCRYVAGIMENENYTHAWVEVYLENKWYGFDPTNNTEVKDSYIVFARGRDAKDTCKLPVPDKLTGATEYTKHCFWINNAYIRNIFDEYIS